MRVTLIDNYDSFTCNLVHYLGELGADVSVWRNDARSVEETLADEPDAIVLSPGPCTPNEAGICLDLVRAAGATTPMLGVCLGHQAIGQVFGGKVVRAPLPMHGKVSHDPHNARGAVSRHQRPVPGDALPFASSSSAPALPDELEVTAETDDGLIMGVSHARLRSTACSSTPRASPASTARRILENFLDLARACARAAH